MLILEPFNNRKRLIKVPFALFNNITYCGVPIYKRLIGIIMSIRLLKEKPLIKNYSVKKFIYMSKRQALLNFRNKKYWM